MRFYSSDVFSSNLAFKDKANHSHGLEDLNHFSVNNKVKNKIKELNRKNLKKTPQ